MSTDSTGKPFTPKEEGVSEMGSAKADGPPSGPPLRELLLNLFNEGNFEAFQKLMSEQRTLAGKLRNTLQVYQRANSFEPGDLIKWKPFMKNRLYPADSEPAIVVAVLPEPVYDNSQTAASPYFREALDLVCGVIQDDVFITYHLSSARMEHYRGTEQVATGAPSL